MRNEKIIEEIRIADCGAVSAGLDGAPFDVLQPLYMRANAFDVDLDTSISRICRLDYLLDDVRKGVLTHVKALASIWKDPLENPLYTMRYSDPVTGASIDLSKLVGESYALCWTEGLESELAWQTFATSSQYVCISTTPRRLLEGLMHEEDRGYMFHHHIGAVRYRSVADIEHWRRAPNYDQHLDSLGQALIASLTVLREQVTMEQEVRLLYSHMPEAGGWIESHVVADDILAKVPFKWTDVIDSVVLSPGVDATFADHARHDIAAVGIVAPVKNSLLNQPTALFRDGAR